MADTLEITVPETKPATEWINGRALQKVSPQEPHARAQLRLAALLLDWADRTGLGRLGTEWEFRVTPPGEPSRPLVPDISYLSFEALPFESREAARIPRLAPTAAFEILSPGNRAKDVAAKIADLLRCGSAVVVVADPHTEVLHIHDASGARTFGADDTFAHKTLPGFTFRIAEIFAEIQPR